MSFGKGIHRIDIDAYHGQCCPGPSISSTGLRQIVAECPARYWANSDLNPNGVKRETPALALGKAAHALVLGEPEFNAKFVVSPFDNFQTKAAREWRDAQTRQVVRPEDMAVIEEMVAAQRASMQVAHAFIAGEPEMSIIWQDEETGIWLKARPDWLPDNPHDEFVVEYKTAVSIAPRTLSFDAFRYGYHLQAALTLDGLSTVLNVEPLGHAIVCQEKDPPYLAELRMFTAEQIAYGRKQYRHALRVFARCLSADDWPGYTAAPQFIDTPFPVKKLMEDPNEYAARYGDADYLGAG